MQAGDSGATPDGSASGGHDAPDHQGAMLRIVCQQRERARREASALAVEVKGAREQVRALQAASRRLQGDNLALYEKVRFLQSRLESKPGGADAATHISISDESTEAAYKELYEEKMNPFAAFHKRERLQRYSELTPPEKLMLSFSSFFLSNRHARIFLFGYMVCLHLLVSGSMYSVTHRTRC
uniref:CASP C-terminal domain-containing protein n=2 Tax=Chrysotila carterae TaxID=13221 RepID=A0A7S4B6G0_CHRCT